MLQSFVKEGEGRIREERIQVHSLAPDIYTEVKKFMC